jgi:hypothetical protein
MPTKIATPKKYRSHLDPRFLSDPQFEMTPLADRIYGTYHFDPAKVVSKDVVFGQR